MITCSRWENCKRIGVVPERVRRGYGPCRHKGIIPKGKRQGETCTFVDFPEVDVEAANRDILEGRTLAHDIARRAVWNASKRAFTNV